MEGWERRKDGRQPLPAAPQHAPVCLSMCQRLVWGKQGPACPPAACAGDSFFPGTGDSCDIGVGAGKYYSVNVPLRDGMDDASFKFLFDPIMTKIMENYQPGAVVLQVREGGGGLLQRGRACLAPGHNWVRDTV